MLELQEKERLQKRIKQLERWLKVILYSWILSMVIVSLSLTGIQQGGTQSKVIQAQGLVILDDEGKPRIELTTRGKACGLILYDSARNKRISVDVTPDGTPRIVLYKGKRKIVTGIDAEWSTIGLTDTEGNLRSILGVDRKGIAALIFCNDKKDKDRLVICAEPKGIATIRFFDATGKLRIGFGVISGGEPDLRFFNARGKTVFKIP